MTKRFRVAISFSGTERAYAEQIKRHLDARGVTTFYDNDFKHELWGAFLPAKFHEIFGRETDYVIVLVSRGYIERMWPRSESKIIIERALKDTSGFLLPIRFDESLLDGVPLEATGYLDASSHKPAEVVRLVCEKLGLPRPAKASDVPPPQHANLTGVLEFDYADHGGFYVLGSDNLSFDTHWSNVGADAIQVSNRGKNIYGVAIATGAKQIDDIGSAEDYNFSSPYRRPRVGEYVIFENIHGNYCVVKILEVRARSHGADADYLKIHYAILPDGSLDFIHYTVG